jgi:cytochrome P450
MLTATQKWLMLEKLKILEKVQRLESSFMNRLNVPPHVPDDLVIDLDIYNMGDPTEDLHATWEAISDRCQALRENGTPLAYTPHNGGHWIAVSGQALEDLFPDDVNLSNRAISIPPRDAGVTFGLGEADGDEHTVARRAVTAVLTPKMVKGLREPIREIVEDLVSEIKPRGSCEFMADFAQRLPVKLFLGMMHLPLEDADMLFEANHKITRGTSHADKSAGLSDVFDYLQKVVDERYDAGGSDVISKIAQYSSGGERLSKEKVVGISVNLLLAGLDTAGSMLGFIVRHLAQNEQLRRELAAHPDRIERASGELIRRFPIVTLGRIVANDFSYAGIDLKAGECVALPTPLHGMDKCKFANPLEVELNRRIPVNMSFGKGRHLCVGNFVARVELVEALTVWMHHIPEFRIEPGASIEVEFGQVSVINRLPLQWDV